MDGHVPPRASALARLDLNRLVRAAVLGGFALLIGKLMLTGQLVKYLNASLDPLSAVVGLLMLAMAAVEAGGAWSRSPIDRDDDHDHDGWGLEQGLTYVVVAGTLALGLLVAPKALSSAALGGEDLSNYLLAFDWRAAPTAPSGDGGPGKPVQDVPDLLGYLERVGEAGVGQPVRVVGLVAQSGVLEPGEFPLLRYAIVHCVADARPMAFLVANAGEPPEFDRWVRVEGVVSIRERAGARLLTIDATSVTPVGEPVDPYIHPPF